MGRTQNRLKLAAVAALVIGGGATLGLWAADGPNLGDWEVHDMKRPKPPVVDPGAAGTPDQPGKPPSDAVVLFGGQNTDMWDGKWKVQDGVLVAGGGDFKTKEAYGDCQFHIEWSAPTPPQGEGQGRGNSGVYFMGQYEVQVLDSHQNETYADGQAAALYGQYPPLVNVTRPPGEWNTYDIIFHGPRFGADGKVERPATVTVLHNGVLVQNHSVMTGPSGHHSRPPYKQHPEKLPISLQDHGNPVRFRNIWIRPLGETPTGEAKQAE